MDTPVAETTSSNPSNNSSDTNSGISRDQKNALIFSGLGVVLMLAVFLFGVYLLLLPSTDTAKWRDLFIIILTIETFLLLGSIVILVFQVARLVNLVQNEVQPVLESANETINTLRGTAVFLSDNLVSPVVKVNSYIAVVKRMLGLINTGK